MDPYRFYESHWLACMAAVGGGRVTRLAGGLVLASPGVSGAFVNCILPRDCTAERLPDLLEAGGAMLAAAGEPPALFLSPDAGDVNALAGVLLDRGWRPAVHQVVLSCDLPLSVPDGGPGIQVDEVGPATVEEWVKTLAAAYGAEPERSRSISQAWAGLAEMPGEGSRSLLCLARWEGHPVGTGLAWAQGGTAALYCGAVLPQYRRRGVERATLLYRLQWAAAVGCRQAILQTDTGSPVEHLCVDRLGFGRCYQRTLWIPAGNWNPFACG